MYDVHNSLTSWHEITPANPCNIKNNLGWKHRVNQLIHFLHSLKKTFKMYHESNFRNKNVIHLLDCIHCLK